MNVSAQATPMPETMPERRLFDSVRWMQSTATGPTVIEAATPTQMPRNRVSTISNAIFSVCCASRTRLLLILPLRGRQPGKRRCLRLCGGFPYLRSKDTKKLRHPPMKRQKKGAAGCPAGRIC